MLDFETSNFKSEVSKSNLRKITSFSKTTSLFLTMFYTINLSPFLVIKKGFMTKIILSNYQQCPLPFTEAGSNLKLSEFGLGLCVDQAAPSLALSCYTAVHAPIPQHVKTPSHTACVCLRVNQSDTGVSLLYYFFYLFAHFTKYSNVNTFQRKNLATEK